MYKRDKALIQKALDYNPSADVFGLGIYTNKGNTSRKEVYIDNDFFANSTLDIWQTKDLFCPEITQYIKHNNLTMEFELSFACFMNPDIDLYHYTFKRCI